MRYADQGGPQSLGTRVHFDGVTGHVSFDEYGDRVGTRSWVLSNSQQAGGVRVGSCVSNDVGGCFADSAGSADWSVAVDSIVWPGNPTADPRDFIVVEREQAAASPQCRHNQAVAAPTAGSPRPSADARGVGARSARAPTANSPNERFRRVARQERVRKCATRVERERVRRARAATVASSTPR